MIFRRLSAFFLLAGGALSVFSSAAYASNCPNPAPKYLLDPNTTNRLVADVTIIDRVPPVVVGWEDSLVVEVAAVYAGAAPRRIVIESYEIDGFGCVGSPIAREPVGTRMMIAVQQFTAQGRYGGGLLDYFIVLEDETVTGRIDRPDCAIDDNDCLYARRTVSLAEFGELAETYFPGQFSEKTTVEASLATIALSDGTITLGSEVAVSFDLTTCDFLTPNSVQVGTEQYVLELSYDLSSLRFADITPAPPCPVRPPQAIPVGRVFETGEYVVRLYREQADSSEGFFKSENFVGEIPFEVAEPSQTAFPETPVEGSVQSGVGLIRGWACDAQSIIVQFDNLPPFELAYGTSRPDTIGVCSDTNNGYGTVFAWGSLGEGAHRMRSWIDGELISNVDFEVRGLGDPFVQGLSGQYTLEGFPTSVQSVVVRWSEPDQNFIIVDRGF